MNFISRLASFYCDFFTQCVILELMESKLFVKDFEYEKGVSHYAFDVCK